MLSSTDHKTKLSLEWFQDFSYRYFKSLNKDIDLKTNTQETLSNIEDFIERVNDEGIVLPWNIEAIDDDPDYTLVDNAWNEIEDVLDEISGICFLYGLYPKISKIYLEDGYDEHDYLAELVKKYNN